jgi:SAM-dependent methyltransferase
MEERYRDNFAGRSRAEAYDEIYASSSYSSLLWEIEKKYLNLTVANLRAILPIIDYLDYACGTGRVLSFLEPLVDSATGVDASQEMLDRARLHCERACLLRGDISEDASLLGTQKYDLITLFRFMLNTEPSTRARVMEALAGQLRDGNSRLVFNNHGNPFSHKMVMWPVHRMRRLGRPRERAGNYLTHREIVACVRGAGLEIESVSGFGYLSAKMLRLLGFAKTLRLERFLARTASIQALGATQLYVCRLRGSGPQSKVNTQSERS